MYPNPLPTSLVLITQPPDYPKTEWLKMTATIHFAHSPEVLSGVLGEGSALLFTASGEGLSPGSGAAASAPHPAVPSAGRSASGGRASGGRASGGRASSQHGGWNCFQHPRKRDQQKLFCLLCPSLEVT